MSSNIGKKLLGAVWDGSQGVIQKHIDEETLWVKKMDIMRAAVALLDANVEEETIKRLLCKYCDLRLCEAHKFIHEDKEERKM